MKLRNSKNIPTLTTDEQGKLLGGYTSPDSTRSESPVDIKNRNCHGSATITSPIHYENYNCHSTCGCK